MRTLFALGVYVIGWTLLRARPRPHPYDCPPAAGPRSFVSEPPEPLTMDDVPAPPAPTWGVQRGAC